VAVSAASRAELRVSLPPPVPITAAAQPASDPQASSRTTARTRFMS
jgi:hypothetical protein